MFSSPSVGMQTYGAGNGFSFQPMGSNGDRQAAALAKASAWKDSLQSQAGAFSDASSSATQFGIAQMQMESQERIAKMQADAAAKAQQKRGGGGFLGGALGIGGAVASLIPGGQAIGAGLLGAGKLFG